MADNIDRASNIEEFNRNNALINRNTYHGESALICWDCGEPIPQGRRVAVPGVKYCIECQKDIK